MRPAPSGCGTASTGSAATSTDARSRGQKKGDADGVPFFDLLAEAYRFFAFLAFLAAFFAFFAIGRIPPFRLGYASRVAAPPAVASAAWHSARGCRRPA